MVDISMKIVNDIIISVTIAIVIYNLKMVKVQKKDLVIISFINFSIININILKKLQFLLPVSFCIIIIFLVFITKQLYLSVLSVSLTYLITSALDLILGLVLMNMVNYNYQFINNNYYINSILYCVFSIVSIGFSKLIGKLFNKIKKENTYFKYEIKKNIHIIVYLIISSVILYINTRIYKCYFEQLDRTIILLNITLLIVYFFASILIVYISIKNEYRKVKYEYKNKELKQLKEYTSMIETLSDDLRKFRHDYINILSSLNAYMEEDDYKGLKKYFNEVILSENISISEKNKNLSLLKNVKVMGLKGLLSSKIIKAQSLGIDVYIDIHDEINEISVEIIDLCRIIGILFDNAIEGAVLCDTKNINFGIIKNESYITIVINNICLKHIPPIYKLYEKGFSTKGKDRGVGLSIVKDIIDKKYENILLNTTTGARKFKQEIIIYKKSKWN